jgi:5-methylcytosine-specific restriction endonuclease McrA
MTETMLASRERQRPRRCLVLNADGRPLSTWPLSLLPAEDAVHALYRERVSVVESWQDAVFRSPSVTIPVPKVVMLRHYAPVAAEPKFCRRSILLRDRYRCGYCGEQFASEELTFDHVVPRARAARRPGRTSSRPASAATR